MPFRSRQHLASVLLLAALIATVAVYWPGLSGPFVFDDHQNIVLNQGLDLGDLTPTTIRQAALAGDAGPLGRPLSMLSFAFNRYFTGLDPFPFKFANLAIHLLNGVLVYLLGRALLASDGRSRSNIDLTAAIAASLWLLHPVQLTSVLYVVQRMTSLSATFVLLGLLTYVRLRTATMSTRHRQVLLWFGVPAWTIAAALSKENGVLLIAYAFVIEATFFRFIVDRSWRFATPNHFFWAGLVVPLLVIFGWLLTHPDWLTRAAELRGFSATDRMLTQSRVLFEYIEMLFVPAISNLALFHDDLVISRGLFDPWTTAVAVGLIFALVVVASLGRRRWPWFTFAVWWFIAGHAMESTFVLLEMVHAHRNYLPYVGPILAVVVGVTRLFEMSSRRLSVPVVLLALSLLAGTTALRASQWRNPLDLALYEVRHRPTSPRANYEVGRLLHKVAIARKDDAIGQEARRYLLEAARLAPTEVTALIGVAIVDRGAVAPEILDAIKHRLERYPMLPGQVVALNSLVRCEKLRECEAPPETVLAIFNAALRQPKQRPSVKADILTLLATYYAQRLGDYSAAVRVMEAAAELAPDDPNRHINLAQVALFIPDFEMAAKALEQARRSDELGRNSVRIAAVSADLERFMQRTQK